MIGDFPIGSLVAFPGPALDHATVARDAHARQSGFAGRDTRMRAINSASGDTSVGDAAADELVVRELIADAFALQGNHPRRPARSSCARRATPRAASLKCRRHAAPAGPQPPPYASRAAHRLAAVGRRPPVDHELSTVDRDDSERVDVDREQIPVRGRLEAPLGRQPSAKL